jgi:hypothetical protein
MPLDGSGEKTYNSVGESLSYIMEKEGTAS